MPPTKAVVLARGLGSRMRRSGGDTSLRPEQAAAADEGAKAMMPIATSPGAGRPFLDFVLSALADAGYRTVCLVMGPDHEAARRYYTELAPPSRLAVEFATQDEPRGTADAVAAAARFIDGELALVINGDNYYPVSALAALARMDGPATALFRSSVLAARGNIPPERVRAFAVCTVGGDGCLARIIEKPTDEEMQQAGADPLVSMNCWLVPPAIVEACRAIGPSARGEIELTHAVTYSIDRLGVRYRVLIGEDTVLDLSSRADVASVAAHLAGVSARP